MKLFKVFALFNLAKGESISDLNAMMSFTADNFGVIAQILAPIDGQTTDSLKFSDAFAENRTDAQRRRFFNAMLKSYKHGRRQNRFGRMPFF